MTTLLLLEADGSIREAEHGAGPAPQLFTETTLEDTPVQVAGPEGGRYAAFPLRNTTWHLRWQGHGFAILTRNPPPPGDAAAAHRERYGAPLTVVGPPAR